MRQLPDINRDADRAAYAHINGNANTDADRATRFHVDAHIHGDIDLDPDRNENLHFRSHIHHYSHLHSAMRDLHPRADLYAIPDFYGCSDQHAYAHACADEGNRVIEPVLPVCSGRSLRLAGGLPYRFTMTTIPIEKILPNPEQPRKAFDQAQLDELAQSIRENGVILPIVVEEAPDGFFILIDGERRVRASRMAGLAEIPASISPSLNGSGKRDRLTRALVANIQRADLNPIEEARAYDGLRNCGMTVKNISLKIGINQTRIAQRLQLLKLDAEIQELIAAGRLSKDSRVVESLLSIPDDTARVELAQALAGRSASIQTCVKAAGTLVQKLSETAAQPKDSIPAVDLAQARAQKPLSLPKWDMLAQLGHVPPWGVVIWASRSTCENCALRPVASEKNCRDCPAVELIRNMIENRSYSVQEKKHV